jgi:DNA-binding MarR family transcriptional regulator
MKNEFDGLKLENQLCFPLYAASKEVIRRHRPILKEIDLTYTQYITLLVLWENQHLNVKELGKRLYLDSGTLTPVLKYLERKGLLVRSRLQKDERHLEVKLTEKGYALKKEAENIPARVAQSLNLTVSEINELQNTLYKILASTPDD